MGRTSVLSPGGPGDEARVVSVGRGDTDVSPLFAIGLLPIRYVSLSAGWRSVGHVQGVVGRSPWALQGLAVTGVAACCALSVSEARKGDACVVPTGPSQPGDGHLHRCPSSQGRWGGTRYAVLLRGLAGSRNNRGATAGPTCCSCHCERAKQSPALRRRDRRGIRAHDCASLTGPAGPLNDFCWES